LHPETVRKRALAAAYHELKRWGIDRFSVVPVADNHGLNLGGIRQQWDNDERLMLDVFLSWPTNAITAPDTGSLRTDLLALAAGMASYVNSEIGPRLQIAHLIENPNLSRDRSMPAGRR
jgi:hypothetical protein